MNRRVSLLSQIEGNILVSNHVLDLATHGEEDEHQPVHEENGPIHGDIECFEETAEEGDAKGSCRIEPLRK